MITNIIDQRNRAKDDCKQRLVEFADRTLAFNKKESSSNYRKYQCPWCGSGTGKHQTGNLTIYMNSPTHCKCLVCGNGGDIYSLVGQIYGLDPKTQFGEIVQKVFDELNVDVPKLGDSKPKEYVPTLPQKVESAPENPELEEYILQLAKADILEAEKHLEECDYLTKRYIPLEVQRRFRCGFLPCWVHPKTRAKYGNDYSLIEDYFKSPRIIIPDGDLANPDSYTARAIRIEDEAGGFKAMKTANPKAFNAEVLNTTEPQVVFLVEGAIDTMSIETVGFKSLAIGSTSYVNKFFNSYTIHPNTTLVVALDNDKAGVDATNQVVEQCKHRGIYCIVADMDIYGSCKDANELLINSSELLKENLNKMVSKSQDTDLREKYFKDCKRMEEIENNVIPKDINIVSTDISEFPEVTFENIKSTEVINHFGKLPTQEAVMSYYMYLTEKAKKFRMSSECKPIFDYAKKVKLNHIKDWNNNPNIRVTNNKQDLPKWVTFNARGNAIINETIYCKQKIAQKDIRTIGGKIYNIDGEVKESGLRREIIDDISPYVTSGLSRMVEALYSAIKIFTYSEMPDADAKKIHVLNGAIDISKFKTTGQFLFSPNKEWCVNRLSVKFNPDAKHPVKFLKLLDELLEKDDIKTLQEYMGYGFIPSTIAQKLLFIVGNGGEGKSLLGNIYKQVIGAHNTYSAHIQKLQNKPCELANCINKLMNIDDDTEAKAFEDTGTLKEIISGGSVTVEPKYVQPYSTTLYTRLMCFSNASLQALYDRSDGFYRRQLIIRTKPKAKNRVDNPNLMNEIVAEELEGIFLWCLDGLKRLISNNFIFTVSEKSKHLVEQSQREGFNFIEYLEDTNEIAFEETQATTSVDLYSAYCNWCHQNGKDIIKRNVVLGWLKDHSNKYNIKDDCNVIDRNSGRRCRGFKGIRVIRSYNQNVCCA